MLQLAIFIIIQVGTLAAFAGNAPNWANRRPASDNSYKYYVGKSSNCLSEHDAYKEVQSDAYEQALRENFGTTTQYKGEVYSTLKATNAIQQVDEETQHVHITDFEIVDSSIEACKNDGVNLKALYKYKLSAIQTEKNRLVASLPSSEPVMSVIGSQTDVNNGTVELITKPARARVLIDGEAWGRTPIRLNGQLSLGTHRVVLDHPQYETEEFDVRLIPKKLNHIERILTRAMGSLLINTNIEKAAILVGGVLYNPGKDGMRLPSGIPIKVEVSHPDAFSVSREVILEKGESRTLEIPLELKPATVTLRCPHGADVMVDDIKKGSCDPGISMRLNIEPGHHEVSVTQDGFETETKSFTANPNQFIHLGYIPLKKLTAKPISEPVPQENTTSETPDSKEPKNGVTVYYCVRGKTLNNDYAVLFDSLEAAYQRRIFWHLNILGAFSYDSNGQSSNNSSGSSSSTSDQFNMTGFSWRLGLPYDFNEYFYFEPEYGHISHTYTSSTTPFNFSVSQSFYGAQAGMKLGSPQFKLDVGFGFRQYNNAGNVNGNLAPSLNIGFGYFF